MPGSGGSVVLVGRTNVGKSTLFNRITATRRAIVTPVAGTTRDAQGRPVVWRNHSFHLTDTGGLFGASDDPLHALVVARGRKAVDEADLVVFVVDGRAGLVAADTEIAATLRRAGVPVVVAINKVDDRRARAGALEFYRLGFEPVLEISAEHGTGVEELLEAIVARLPPPGSTAPPVREPDVDVAIVGRPNVGKSSLVNRLLQEERMIVSDVPGTTRDAVDAVVRWHRREFRIVDTAGIRRPGQVARSGQVEAVSVVVARRAIERADVVAIVVDASTGIVEQDAAIAGAADKAGRGVIIVANKWDLVRDRGPDFVRTFDEQIRDAMKFLDYAPIVHLSARTGERVPKLLETIDRVAESRRRRVGTAELNKFIQAVSTEHPPISRGRRSVRILYAAQTTVAPPTFVLFTNIAVTFHFSYERYLVNRIREAFGFMGTPIRLQVRARSRKNR
jgi:GTP-binding protein